MTRLLVTLLAVLGTLSISAQTDTTIIDPATGDTTRVKVGGYDVTIVPDGSKETKEDRKKSTGDNVHWAGLDIGFSGYMRDEFNPTMAPGYEFLELDYAKSWTVGLNIIEKDVRLVGPYVKLATGLGFEWNMYSFKNNTILTPDVRGVSGMISTTNDFDQNRLKASWVKVPLFLQFNTSRNASRSFHLAAGMHFGYNFLGKQKMSWEEGDVNYKLKVRDDFEMNPLRYGPMVRIGYGDFTLFANYTMTPMFKSGSGPELFNLNAGISLIGF